MSKYVDWEAARSMLSQLEVCEHTICLRNFNEDAHEIVSLTMEWLFDHGLAKGHMLALSNELAHDFYFEELTWLGHELIEFVRNDHAWEQVQKRIEAHGQKLDMTNIQFHAIQYATEQAKQQIL